MSYLKLGDRDKAHSWFLRAWETDSIGSFGLFAGARLAYLEGTGEAWIHRIRELEQTIVDAEAIYLWAVINVMLDDNQHGLQMLDKAVKQGYFPYRTFEINPFLDPVKKDPEFKRILEDAKVKSEAFRAKHF